MANIKVCQGMDLYKCKGLKLPQVNDAVGAVASVIFFAGLLLTFGYVHGLPLLYGNKPSLVMAAIFILLGTGLLAVSGLQAFPLRLISGPSTYARLMRIFLPLIIAMLLFDHWLDDAVISQSSHPAFVLFLFSLMIVVVWSLVIGRLSKKIAGQIDHAEAERRKMQDLLLQAKNEWEDTFNIINDAITVHDNDFNIICANKAAETILGISYKEILGRKCYESYHGMNCSPRKCPSCLTLKTGKESTTEMFEPHLNMFLEIKAMPRLDQMNKVIGVVHVVRDITAHKKLEDQFRQSQKMEAIGHLAGGMAHDFNNILTSITGDAYLAQMKLDKDSVLMGYMEDIKDTAETGANLIRGLLAFSRKQIISPRPENLNEIVAGVERLMTRLVGGNIKFRTVTAKRDLMVVVDSAQVQQVLLNLVTNAKDAMPEGGELTISTDVMEIDNKFVMDHSYGRRGKYALLSVSDTGVGMDEKTRERIFEPFFTTKEVGKGTGLGLATVYGIIKQHNGYIEVQSRPSQGTTFRIYLPLSNIAHVVDIEREAKAV